MNLEDLKYQREAAIARSVDPGTCPHCGELLPDEYRDTMVIQVRQRNVNAFYDSAENVLGMINEKLPIGNPTQQMIDLFQLEQDPFRPAQWWGPGQRPGLVTENGGRGDAQPS